MNYLFVDGNSLGYYHQQSDKLHNSEMEVQAAFGFVKNVRRYASILHARPMILWDGFSDKRRDFYPEYKANRDDDPDMKKMKEGFAIQKPYILKMMTALGVRSRYWPRRSCRNRQTARNLCLLHWQKESF